MRAPSTRFDAPRSFKRAKMAGFSHVTLGAAACGALALSLTALLPAPAAAQGRGKGADKEANIDAAALSAGVNSRRLTLGVGRTVIYDLPSEAAEIIVGDPKIANAVVRSTRKLYVIGVGMGQTTIIAMDRDGRQIANLELNIGRDFDTLEKLLRTAVPKSKIIVKTINESIVLTGEAASAADVATAMDIAKAFLTKGDGQAGTMSDRGIVNAMTVRGGDQVMVKVTIAEVQRTILKQLGVSTSPGGAETIFKSSWATLNQQNPFALNGNVTNSGLTVPLGTGLSATLSAFERYGVSRVLAEPTVTAVSGESAKFTVGGEVPYPSSSNCTAASPTSAYQYCSVGVAYKPYGVSLAITPVVLSEGRILVRIATEVTEIDTTQSVTISSIAVPGFRTRKNETSVELPSGGSLATAGLITNNSRHAINGLPGLLNLPILGALFRSRDYQRQETEMMIVVTPYIAKSVAPSEVQRPDDGFSDASDPQAWLLGRVNKLYSTKSNPQAVQNWKGRFGFIQD